MELGCCLPMGPPAVVVSRHHHLREPRHPLQQYTSVFGVKAPPQSHSFGNGQILETSCRGNGTSCLRLQNCLFQFRASTFQVRCRLLAFAFNRNEAKQLARRRWGVQMHCHVASHSRPQAKVDRARTQRLASLCPAISGKSSGCGCEEVNLDCLLLASCLLAAIGLTHKTH